MIADPEQGVPPARPSAGCVWLDYLRGPEGANHLACRLTAAIFGAGSRQDAVCLELCAYPKQHARGRCQHMDVINIVPTHGQPTLPKIHCLAHHNYDAPGLCAACPDYLAPEPA